MCAGTNGCVGGVCASLPGLPALGDACTTSCRFPGVCVDGTCRELDLCAKGHAGDPCTGEYASFPPHDTCAAGLYCLAGACVPLVRLGASCNPVTAECADGAYCRADTGVCEMPLALDHYCASGAAACMAGTHCDIRSSFCATDLEDGAPCYEDSDCTGGICANQDCPGGVCTAGTCASACAGP